MKIIPATDWIPSDGLELEDAALASIKSSNNILVIAGPGAGKTELLAQKASYLFETNNCRFPRKILAISFKKDAAQNLKCRIEKRCSEVVKERFHSMTYDAFSKSILDQFLNALPKEMVPKRDYCVNDKKVVTEAFKKAVAENPSFHMPDEKLYDTIIRSVSFPFLEKNLASVVWQLLLKGFDAYLPTLTFSMISMLSEYIVRINPKIKRSLQITYQYVFLDEFQDTTTLQYNLVKQCFLRSDSLVTAVGDNKQRIMLWAGARKTIFADFKKDFQAEENRLLMNYRSAPRLVDLQKRMYASLHEPEIETLPAGPWNENDGLITLLISDSEKAEASNIALRILNQINCGYDPTEICILCKQKTKDYTSLIIKELEQYKIQARIEDIYQDLLHEPVVKIIVTLLKLVSDERHPDEWIFIMSTLSDLWNLNPDSNGYLKIQLKISDKLEQLKQFQCQMKGPDDFFAMIDDIMNFLDYTRIKASFPVYEQDQYLQKMIFELKNRLWDELNRSNFNWKQAIENFEGLHSIPIMTIHKSKGLEYKAVYFVGLEDSAFWNFKLQSEEDRCAFFVALSRAKQELTFTFCNRRESFRYPNQSHRAINEFYELLQTPGIATVVNP